MSEEGCREGSREGREGEGRGRGAEGGKRVEETNLSSLVIRHTPSSQTRHLKRKRDLPTGRGRASKEDESLGSMRKGRREGKERRGERGGAQVGRSLREFQAQGAKD